MTRAKFRITSFKYSIISFFSHKWNWLVGLCLHWYRYHQDLVLSWYTQMASVSVLFLFHFFVKEFKFKWPLNYEIGNLKKWSLEVIPNLGLHMYYDNCKNKEGWVCGRLYAGNAPKINPMNRLSNTSRAIAQFLWRCWFNCIIVVLWVFCSVFKGEQICLSYTRHTCGYAFKTWTHILIAAEDTWWYPTDRFSKLNCYI